MDEVLDKDSKGTENNPDNTSQTVSKERMLPQSAIDKIVAGVKHESFEKGLMQGRSEADANKTQMQSNASSPASPALGGMPGLTEDQIRQIIGEESQKHKISMDAERFAQDFWNKVNSGKGKYDSTDFENTISSLNIPNSPKFAGMLSNLDNLSDVVYHLGKNGSKYATLLALSQSHPALAINDLSNLSNSLKANDSVPDPYIREPLSQVKRSMVGSDTGNKTIRDLRKLPVFRG